MENNPLRRIWLITSLIVILAILIPLIVTYLILSFIVLVSPELQVIVIACFFVLGVFVIFLRRNRRKEKGKTIVRG